MKLLWVLFGKTYFVVEFLKGEWLKILILGKLGLKLEFWNNISSHSHTFLFLIFNALRCVFKNQVIFSKKHFSRFSINWNCFLINRILWIRFFKNGFWLFQKHFFKSFLSFLSLSLSLWFRLGSTSDFYPFWSFFLQGFSLEIPVRPFYPFFCFYFLISCIFNLGILNLYIFGVFDD